MVSYFDSEVQDTVNHKNVRLTKVDLAFFFFLVKLT